MTRIEIDEEFAPLDVCLAGIFLSLTQPLGKGSIHNVDFEQLDVD